MLKNIVKSILVVSFLSLMSCIEGNTFDVIVPEICDTTINITPPWDSCRCDSTCDCGCNTTGTCICWDWGPDGKGPSPNSKKIKGVPPELLGAAWLSDTMWARRVEEYNMIDTFEYLFRFNDDKSRYQYESMTGLGEKKKDVINPADGIPYPDVPPGGKKYFGNHNYIKAGYINTENFYYYEDDSYYYFRGTFDGLLYENDAVVKTRVSMQGLLDKAGRFIDYFKIEYVNIVADDPSDIIPKELKFKSQFYKDDKVRRSYWGYFGNASMFKPSF